MKLVRCIRNSSYGFPSKKGNIYIVKKEDNNCYTIHGIKREVKERFEVLRSSEKILKVLYEVC